ncbi:Kinesin-like protein kif3c, partial [Dermatophagoides pteronyssinus]
MQQQMKPSSSKSECVKVVVRCRPMSDKEKEEKELKVVDVNCERGTIQLHRVPMPPPSWQQQTTVNNHNDDDDVKIYTFDSVYDCDSKQEEIYADVCHPLVESVLNGFNGTIFAYGQTGTGKTYTMEGVAHDPGVIPRSFIHIFSHIGRSSHKQFLVRSSYLEIYQEEIRDLLSTNTNKRLELRERSDIGVYVKDLSSFVCKNVTEIERVLAKGRQNRAVGATNMNEHSSRSHAIFMITVEHIEKDSSMATEHVRVGKLNLVDLAGSERQIKTKTVGQRQKEAIKINLSLSALGNVISALVDGRSTHIPYRDSKLTRILQDSLGGNARTVMMANIGPAGYNYEETLITLRYANRAKNIKNKPRVNENPKDTLLKEFQAEIDRLRAQLEEKRKQKSRPSSSLTASTTAAEQIDVEAVQKLQAKIKAMESKMLVGGKDIVDHTNEQQRQLEQRMAQLREQRQRERQMLRQLEAHEEATQEVRETFSSLQQEVEMKRKKLRKVVKEFQSVNSEIRDLHESHSDDRRELERISSDLIRDLKLRYLMIDNFIPEYEKTRFLRKVYYDDNDQEWHLKSESINQSMIMSEDEQSRPCTASSIYPDQQNGENCAKIDLVESGGTESKNRAKTATTTALRNRHESTNEWSSIGYDWNQRTVGRTPPRMRRSLTVMDNYFDDENEWHDNDGGSIDHIDSINSFFDIKRASTRKQFTRQQQQQQQQQLNLNQRPDTAFPRSRGLVP